MAYGDEILRGEGEEGGGVRLSLFCLVHEGVDMVVWRVRLRRLKIEGVLEE